MTCAPFRLSRNLCARILTGLTARPRERARAAAKTANHGAAAAGAAVHAGVVKAGAEAASLTPRKRKTGNLPLLNPQRGKDQIIANQSPAAASPPGTPASQAAGLLDWAITCLTSSNDRQNRKAEYYVVFYSLLIPLLQISYLREYPAGTTGYQSRFIELSEYPGNYESREPASKPRKQARQQGS